MSTYDETDLDRLLADVARERGDREKAERERDEARAAIKRVEALAVRWEEADGEPVSVDGVHRLCIANRHGRELRLALEGGDHE